ncbi:hypothetical protein B0H11DRAFT_1931928 [Mycena galericulata]|nr:hypothetical protein B0H11DRAFT_1931928 [Mycena galericulata]
MAPCVGLPTVPSTGTADLETGRDGKKTAVNRQMAVPSSILAREEAIDMLSGSVAYHDGRQFYRPAPVPSILFADGSTGRDGQPLTAPVMPVKTGTVGSPILVPVPISTDLWSSTLINGWQDMVFRMMDEMVNTMDSSTYLLFIHYSLGCGNHVGGVVVLVVVAQPLSTHFGETSVQAGLT